MAMLHVITISDKAGKPSGREPGVAGHAGFIEFEEVEVYYIRILSFSRVGEHTCLPVKCVVHFQESCR